MCAAHEDVWKGCGVCSLCVQLGKCVPAANCVRRARFWSLATEFGVHYVSIFSVWTNTGTNISTSEEVAIKLESVKSKHPQLLYE